VGQALFVYDGRLVHTRPSSCTSLARELPARGYRGTTGLQPSATGAPSTARRHAQQQTRHALTAGPLLHSSRHEALARPHFAAACTAFPRRRAPAAAIAAPQTGRAAGSPSCAAAGTSHPPECRWSRRARQGPPRAPAAPSGNPPGCTRWQPARRGPQDSENARMCVYLRTYVSRVCAHHCVHMCLRVVTYLCARVCKHRAHVCAFV